MPTLGKVVHISFDLVLASTLLAGIRRSNGFTPNFNYITNNDDKSVIKTYGEKYLNVGEYVYDGLTTYFASSPYFKRS